MRRNGEVFLFRYWEDFFKDIIILIEGWKMVVERISMKVFMIYCLEFVRNS